ncbi:heme-binding protein soul4 isoform X3 [Pristis pectinata]|nr:heme-binding protein soul4 isoform X3 [Pristis pectinata]XP_051880108.1 heme-binding protein soul4 isoform X3 [Pristis pectinata]
MSRITLEELIALEDVPLDDVAEATPEPVEEDHEQQEQRFAHWQRVANAHQVDLPRNMIGPIQQLSRNNQAQEVVPHQPIRCHEKCNEVIYEERLYLAGKWAHVITGEKLYEQSISMAFMKLMRYICSENSAGHFLGMTIPIINEIQMTEERNGLVQDIITGYYLPAHFQDQPPQPADPDIIIVERQAMRIISRSFHGSTTEQTILHEIETLSELLGSTDSFLTDTYIVATYENPSVPHQRNEIWFISHSQ